MAEPRESHPDGTDDDLAVPLLGAAGSRLAVAALVLAVVGGAIVGGIYLPEEWHIARKIAGGAVAGFGSWLLVMVGRIIG